jgi:hypothetical protein
MSTRSICILFALAWTGLAGACGEETAIIVTTDLRGFQVPQEIDLLHLELSDDKGVLIGRSFPLVDAPSDFSMKILPGERTPETFALVLYAFLVNVRVAESAPQKVSFVADAVSRATLVLMRP